VDRPERLHSPVEAREDGEVARVARRIHAEKPARPPPAPGEALPGRLRRAPAQPLPPEAEGAAAGEGEPAGDRHAAAG